MPLRHNTGTPGAPPPTPAVTLTSDGVALADTTASGRSARRVDDEAILDAARRLVLTRGLERTTLTDIAREAGLSRMTVYRRWAGLPELLGRMMQREWDRVLAIDAADLTARLAAAPEARSFLVDAIVAGAADLRGSELLQRLLAAEPHLLTPYLVERAGSMHRLARSVIAQGVGLAQQSGGVRAGDPDLLATAVVLTVQSWIVSLGAGGEGHDPALLDGELRLLLDRYLAPGEPAAPAPPR